MPMAADMVSKRTKIYRYLILARTGCLDILSVKTVIGMLLKTNKAMLATVINRICIYLLSI